MLETLDAAAVRRWCAGGLAALQPAPGGDRRAERLSGARRRHRHQPGAHPDLGPAGAGARARRRSAERRPATPHGRVLRLHGPRGAARRARQLRRDRLADPARPGRRARRRGRGARAASWPRALRAASDGGLRGGGRAGRGHRAHRRRGGRRRGRAGPTPTTWPRSPGPPRRRGAEALARTPEQLPVLARAGVVDAGGRGLVRAARRAGRGGHRRGPAATAPAARRRAPAARWSPRSGRPAPPTYAYEVQFLLDAEPAAVERLRAALAGLGDSLVVVGTGDGDAVHLERARARQRRRARRSRPGVAAGRPYRISVTRFADQAPAPGAGPRRPDPTGRAAGRWWSPPATGSPSCSPPRARPWSAATRRPARCSTRSAPPAPAGWWCCPTTPTPRRSPAPRPRRRTTVGVKVSVVPTRSPVQALAALAVRDPARRFDDDVIAMAEAAGACRYGEVCHASREALTVAGRCRPGDVLALVEGEVHLIGADLVETCRRAARPDAGRRRRAGHPAHSAPTRRPGWPTALTRARRAHAGRSSRCTRIAGGQPHYPLLVGVE